MNDTVTKILALADEYKDQPYPFHAEARQALQDELVRLFTPLTDEQIGEIWEAHALHGSTDKQKFYSPHVFARLIAEAHGITGEKNEAT